MAMIAKEIIMFFVLIFVTSQLSSVVCLNLERLQNECVRGRPLEGTVKLECVASEVTIQMAKEGNQTFYCIIYEKNSGDILKFDVLSLGLLEDYDLKYVSNDNILQINVVSILKQRFILDGVKSYLQCNAIPQVQIIRHKIEAILQREVWNKKPEPQVRHKKFIY